MEILVGGRPGFEVWHLKRFFHRRAGLAQTGKLIGGRSSTCEKLRGARLKRGEHLVNLAHVSADIRAPCRGTILRRPSCSNRTSASRTGVRDSPSCAAASFSRKNEPGAKSLSRMRAFSVR